SDHHGRRHGRSCGWACLHCSSRPGCGRDRARPARQISVGHFLARRGRRRARLDAANGTEFFAGDLSEADQKLVWATHYAPVADLFQQQKLGANDIAWKSKPSWYVLATNDHTVHPDLQRWVSKRMGATVTEVASSHVPMLSQPKVV